MIYSGLEFAQHFEIDVGSHCDDALMAVTPAARMIFTFIQMYFIFLNAKVNNNNKTYLTRLTTVDFNLFDRWTFVNRKRLLILV